MREELVMEGEGVGLASTVLLLGINHLAPRLNMP